MFVYPEFHIEFFKICLAIFKWRINFLQHRKERSKEEKKNENSDSQEILGESLYFATLNYQHQQNNDELKHKLNESESKALNQQNMQNRKKLVTKQIKKPKLEFNKERLQKRILNLEENQFNKVTSNATFQSYQASLEALSTIEKNKSFIALNLLNNFNQLKIILCGQNILLILKNQLIFAMQRLSFMHS